MAIWNTQQFGPVEYSEEAVVEFPDGLPAFEDQRQFILVERKETEPVIFLQSLSSQSLCFVTLPVEAIDPAYRIQLDAEDAASLEVGTEGSGLLCLAIVTLSAGATPTANMKAPVVIHRQARKARQVIQREPGHSFRHPLGTEEEQGCL